jgi:hypothetical protein
VPILTSCSSTLGWDSTALSAMGPRVERTLLSAAFDSDFEPCLCSFSLLFSSAIDFNVRTEQKQIEKLRYIHRNPLKGRLVGERLSSFYGNAEVFIS